jgi:two-component system cell cycle response regulator
MPARILILDTVATNRIVLKVKMLAAQFAVDACCNRAEAESVIARHRPDLILMNFADRVEDQHVFCKSLRQSPDTAPIAVIAVGVADTARARFAALDAGADDVMPHPMNDTLLLAHIRSLLRFRSAGQELSLRETTSRALGFEETRQKFEVPARITLATSETENCQTKVAALTDAARRPINTVHLAEARAADEDHACPDLMVIDATGMKVEPTSLFSLVSDLRSRAHTRLAAQLVIVPPELPETAAMFLDLGADDVFMDNGSADELALRAKALVQRKMQQDQLRDTLRSGLNAAVTDPLTGLYNRRYVEPHLTRLAAQSQSSGRNFAVMMLDIDHFKSINDAYGHAAGDQVLVQLSERLRENLRAIDLVARMGGEEFLVAMPRTSVRQSNLTADRLRRLVNNTPFDIGKDRPPVKVSVSVGVAVSDISAQNQQPLDALCDCADKALYVAKSAGRNQVKMSQSAA